MGLLQFYTSLETDLKYRGLERSKQLEIKKKVREYFKELVENEPKRINART